MHQLNAGDGNGGKLDTLNAAFAQESTNFPSCYRSPVSRLKRNIHTE
jgi:hypothetical protein